MKSDESKRPEVSRRQFLGRSAQSVAVGVVGLTATASTALAAARSANERVRLGVIGLRNQGRLLTAELSRMADVDVRAICDVDATQFAPALESLTSACQQTPLLENDFRRLLDNAQIDAVVIATPDHSHAAIAQLACQAGKDIYLESPSTHFIADGEALMKVAHQTSRVVQVGLQQRSGTHFRSAIELIRSGRLGQVHLARAWIVHRRKSIGRKVDCAAPDQVNYSDWLIGAADRTFNPNRFHFNWRWFWEYGGGELSHWGVHMLDIARWGLDVGYPERVSAVGGKCSFDDDQETPDTLAVQYAFPQKSILWEQRLWSSHGVEGRNSGVAFHGEQGTLVVDRGGWKVYDHRENITAEASDLLGAHLRNFVDCIRSRQNPAADLLIGHQASTLCHLGNIAYRLGREVRYNSATGTFGTDVAANSLLRSATMS